MVYNYKIDSSALRKKEFLQYGTIRFNLQDIMLSEIIQSQKTNTAWFHFYEVSKIVQFTEWEWLGGCQSLEEERNAELLINGNKVSAKQDDKL